MAPALPDRLRGKRGGGITSAPEAGPVAALTASTFGALSRLRGKRIFHPHGVGFAGRLTPHLTEWSGAELLGGPEPRPVIARLSRSLGLPEPFPEPLGLALRAPDAYGPGRHQDFLLVSSGERPGLRHLLLPGRRFLEPHYSSLLPYRFDKRVLLVGARRDPTGLGPGPAYSELARRDHAGITLQLTIATPLGNWVPVATLELGTRLPDAEVEALRFDPSNTGGGFELATALNRLRIPAYAGSQRGRGVLPAH